MKKNLLTSTVFFILTAFFSLTSFSQDTSKTTQPKWTIGLSGSFNSYQNIKAHTGFNHTYTYTKTGFRGGIDLSYHFSKRSAVTTGLFYFNVGYKVDYVWIFQQPNDPAIPRNTDVKAGYLDIPAIYNFSIVSQDKIVIYTSTGIVSSILISNNGNTTYEDNSVRKFESLNSFIPSLQLGAGLQYNFNDKLGIKIESQYRLFSKGFDKIMNQSPTTICGTVGIVYKLK